LKSPDSGQGFFVGYDCVPACAIVARPGGQSWRIRWRYTGLMNQIDHFRGALLGLACGDAVGTTLEFKPRGSFTPITDMVADEATALVVTGHRDGHVRLWRLTDFSLLQDLPLHRGAPGKVLRAFRDGAPANRGTTLMYTSFGEQRESMRNMQSLRLASCRTWNDGLSVPCSISHSIVGMTACCSL